MAPLDHHVEIEEELQEHGLYGRTCSCLVDGRFPLCRRLAVRWTDDSDYVPAVKKWLYECGIRFATEVRIHCHRRLTIITSWKMLVKWWLPFYWGEEGNEDLDSCIITDTTRQWALTFCHRGAMTFYYYGNRPKAGRHNWDFVMRVHQGLKVDPTP